jgi:Rod binding domain-containing protein
MARSRSETSCTYAIALTDRLRARVSLRAQAKEQNAMTDPIAAPPPGARTQGHAASSAISATPPDADDAARRTAMRAAAVEFEAVFLSQMLDHAGVGRSPGAMGGGAGEDGFRGMMLAEQGRQMARAGGVGLADHVYRAMLRSEGMDDPAARPSTPPTLSASERTAR